MEVRRKRGKNRMVIGISSPITIGEFLPYLDAASQKKAALVSGLLAPAVDALIHQFLRMGHQVVVFTLDKGLENDLILSGENLKIYVGKYRSRARWRGLTFFHAEIHSLKSFIRKENGRLDVLHAHWSYEFAIAALAAKCPVFCTFRDIAEKIYRLTPNAYRFIRLLMNRYVVSRRRINFIANSPYTRRLLVKCHPTLRIVATIPNPCGLSHLDTLTRHRQEAGNPIIVSISNGLAPWKNIHRLLESFKLVRQEEPDAELHLIGGCFEPSKCGAEFKADGVVLCGAIAHPDLPEKFATATLMVHPSLEESFGNTLIEAMACGLPVIGGDKSGAVPYVLDEGKAGVLCDVMDVHAIAASILGLLKDKRRRDLLREAGFARVKSVFSAEAIAKETLTIYNRVR